MIQENFLSIAYYSDYEDIRERAKSQVMGQSICYINGQLAEQALPSYFNHHGFGVFETFRVRRLGRQLLVLGLALHLKRLDRGNEHIRCKLYSREKILKILEQGLKLLDWANIQDARVRIILFREDCLVQLEPWKDTWPTESGIRAVTVQAERAMPEVKSCSAFVSVVAEQKAKAKGVEEALLVDSSGILREGAWSNFFWFNEQDALITTKSKLLSGITREVVIDIAKDHFDVKEQDSSAKDILVQLKEAFITQATRGVTPIIEIDGIPIGTGKVGSATQRIRDLYEALYKPGQDPLLETFLF